MNKTIKEQIIESFLSLIENQKNVLLIGSDEIVCKNLKQNSCEVTEISLNTNNLETLSMASTCDNSKANSLASSL